MLRRGEMHAWCRICRCPPVSRPAMSPSPTCATSAIPTSPPRRAPRRSRRSNARLRPTCLSDVTASDEGLHPAGDDPDWQESAYLAWCDIASGLGGNHRIGNELNRGTANAWCGVYQDHGARFRWNDEGLPLVILEEAGLCAGPQRIFHDGSSLRFRLEGQGCRAELLIMDEGPRSFANAQSFAGTAGTAGTIFSNNFHVACRVRGMVGLDG